MLGYVSLICYVFYDIWILNVNLYPVWIICAIAYSILGMSGTIVQMFGVSYAYALLCLFETQWKL